MVAETAKPDFLARFTPVLLALNPLLLLLVGYVLNAGINDANLEIAKQKNAIDDLKARAEELRTKADAASISTKTQAEKVTVILKLIEDLTGKNDERRRLAIQAIKIVLPPEEAVNVLSALERSAEPGSKGAFEIKSVLDGDRARLVDDMFSDEQPRRAAALTALRQGWVGDSAVISKLIARAMQDVEARAKIGFPNAPKPSSDPDSQRRSSIYNTAAFLAIAVTPDPDLKKQIVAFAAAAERNSEDTAQQAKKIKARFQ